MNVVDCPPGLSRCVDGRLEKSALGTVSGTATCPWVPLGDCPGDCVEGIVLPEEHARQLCLVEGGVLLRRSAAGADDCHDARFECAASQVIDCDAKQIVATCTQGCALPALDEEVAEGEAVTILCRH